MVKLGIDRWAEVHGKVIMMASKAPVSSLAGEISLIVYRNCFRIIQDHVRIKEHVQSIQHTTDM